MQTVRHVKFSQFRHVFYATFILLCTAASCISVLFISLTSLKSIWTLRTLRLRLHYKLIFFPWGEVPQIKSSYSCIFWILVKGSVAKIAESFLFPSAPESGSVDRDWKRSWSCNIYSRSGSPLFLNRDAWQKNYVSRPIKKRLQPIPL
jgi:hypothetical protein